MQLRQIEEEEMQKEGDHDKKVQPLPPGWEMPALAVVDRMPVHVGPSQMPRVLVPRDGPAAHAIDHPPDQLWSMQRESNGRTSAAFYSANDGAVPAPPLDFSVQRVPNSE